MSYNSKNKVLQDSQVRGGEERRKVDRYLSENLGGYRAEQDGGKLSAYGKYVEPVFHAAEHTARGAYYGSDKEYARAKDEIRSFGSGLNHMDNKYQNEFKNAKK